MSLPRPNPLALTAGWTGGSLYGTCWACGAQLPPPSCATHACAVKIMDMTGAVEVGRIIFWPLQPLPLPFEAKQ